MSADGETPREPAQEENEDEEEEMEEEEEEEEEAPVVLRSADEAKAVRAAATREATLITEQHSRC